MLEKRRWEPVESICNLSAPHLRALCREFLTLVSSFTERAKLMARFKISSVIEGFGFGVRGSGSEISRAPRWQQHMPVGEKLRI
jgi:hypothetical protein